jgi:predicted amidohydrolase YtcJ
MNLENPEHRENCKHREKFLHERLFSRGVYSTLSAASIGILVALATIPALAQRTVDTIVTHGKILTVDRDFRVVEALAIDAGRIIARGTSAEMARYAGRNTRIIDVAGATVIPGLIDNHFHFTRGADTWHQQVRFEGVGSRREALAILAAKAASVPAGGWIMVQGGWTPRQFADAPGGFTLAELDGVAPKNPLFVQEGYSVVYANSLALKAVGLNPADGARRNAAGLVSFQPPMALYDAMPKTSPAQREQNLTDFLHEMNSVGLTGIYSLGQSDFLAARAAKGPLPVRLWETLPFNANDPESATRAAALIERSRPNQFDGQFGIFGLGEVLYGPFFDLAPRKDPWPAEIMSEYGKLATAAARAGWHVHQHVINNNAVTDLLDTLEKVNKTQPIDHLRWTMGHVYDISPANIARAKALGMTLGVHGAAMQAGAHMPLRKIADSGIVFGLGTDATIVSHYSPFVTLGWVVSGLDVGGNRVLDETLTREEALVAHTRSNAYLFFQENALGSLEVGKQADLVVLDRDYMIVPAADIKRIKPTLTMVGGRVVFGAAK